MKKTKLNMFFACLFISLISFSSIIIPIKAAETAEFIKDASQRYLSNLNLKYTKEKIAFLLTTEWDQANRYAMFTPTKVRVGCWSLAIAQILNYHKLLPKGNVSYKCTSGYQINEKLESYKFNWDLFVDKIADNTSKESIEQVAKYCYFTAIIIRYDFGAGNYLLYDNEHTLKLMLERFFKCKVKKYEFKDNSFNNTRNDIIKIIRDEIDNKRPVMFYIESKNLLVTHAVVIDGYLEKEGLFLVHINHGLGGEGNGSFDLFDSISTRGDDRERRVLLTIKPI